MGKSYNHRNAEKKSQRDHHFANGGTPAMWRGRAAVFKDSRKESSVKGCRENFRHSQMSEGDDE